MYSICLADQKLIELAAGLERLCCPMMFRLYEIRDQQLWLHSSCPDVGELRCPFCNLQVPRFDMGRIRVIRHIAFGEKPVYVVLQLPRVRCPQHGIHQIHQSLVRPKCNLSIPFQEWVLTQLGDNESARQFANRIGLPRTAVDRCIQYVATDVRRLR